MKLLEESQTKSDFQVIVDSFSPLVVSKGNERDDVQNAVYKQNTQLHIFGN